MTAEVSHRAERAIAPWTVVVVVALALSSAVTLAGSAAWSSPPDHSTTLVGDGSSTLPLSRDAAYGVPDGTTNGSFAIGGGVSGLYPGANRSLVLAIANPQGFTIVVTSIATSVRATTTKCAAGNLSITAFSGHLQVGARRSAHVTVPAKMASTAPAGCSGARFLLEYRGQATKAAT